MVNTVLATHLVTQLITRHNGAIASDCLDQLFDCDVSELQASIVLAAPLKRTLETKYRMARAKGHLVDGLEEVLESLDAISGKAPHVGLLTVQGGGSDYFSIILNLGLNDVLAIMHVIPLELEGGRRRIVE